MITNIRASKNRLTGIHFAELSYDKMSDTEEVVEEEVQYVHIFLTLSYTLIMKDRMIANFLTAFTMYLLKSFLLLILAMIFF